MAFNFCSLLLINFKFIYSFYVFCCASPEANIKHYAAQLQYSCGVLCTRGTNIPPTRGTQCCSSLSLLPAVHNRGLPKGVCFLLIQLKLETRVLILETRYSIEHNTPTTRFLCFRTFCRCTYLIQSDGL